MFRKILLTLPASLLLFGFILPISGSAGDRFSKPQLVDGTIKVHRVQVTWEEQSKVKKYKLRLKTADCEELIKTYSIDSDKVKKKMRNLEQETEYCVQMRAVYNNGTKDEWSKKLKFTTLTATPRFGLNFIRFFSSDSDDMEAATQPEVVNEDFNNLGLGVYRQLTSADLIWSNVETSDGTFDFTREDAVLTSLEQKPIVGLFSSQYADGTTPWDELMGDDTPEKSMTTEQEDYIGTVVDRYKDYVKYWEIGNEMAHWELTNPGEFSVEEQGAWLASVSEVIREHDADAIIVLSGLISITDDNVDDWLPGAVAGGGTDWFDVVGYHYYGRWQGFNNERAGLQAVMEDLGIADKPVWMTETGTSSDSSNTDRTNYPNSEAQQSADIFRRALQAYAAEDDMMIWHTYIGNDDNGQEFRYFGVVNEDLTKQDAYYTSQLLTSEVIPFVRVVQVEDEQLVYRVKRNDHSKVYVAWSQTTGTWTIPEDMSEMTSVVPNANETFTWESVTPGESVDLTTVPVLVR